MLDNVTEPVTPVVTAAMSSAERSRRYRERKREAAAAELIHTWAAEEKVAWAERARVSVDAEGRMCRGPEQKPIEPIAQEEPAPAPINISKPPKRLPVSVKGAWVSLPEPVREGIIAREIEFEAAFRKYDGLGDFAREAERNGTTLANAVRDYSAVESSLRTDFAAGIAGLCKMFSVDPADLAIKLDPDMGAKIHAVGRATGFAEGRTAGVIEQFARERPDFEALRGHMAALAKADPTQSLESLYEQARWADPLTREAEMLKRQQPSPSPRNAATTRVLGRMNPAAKHIGGAPSTAPRPPPDHAAPGESIDETVRKALARQRGTR